MILAGQAPELLGRGRHPAFLNPGDRFSYALAMSLGEPLLLEGGDSAATGVAPAPPP